MSALTDNEIAVLIALTNWGPGPGDAAAAVKFLDVAIAVCRAESSGDPNAVSNTGDYGLWQINKAAHPQYFSPTAQAGYIFDPLNNTVVAKKIYTDAGGWSPWSTYKNGSYKSHLGHGAKAYQWLQKASQTQIQTVLTSASSKNSDTTPGSSFNNPIANGTKNPSLNDLLNAGSDKLGIPNPLAVPGMIFGKVYEGMKTVGIFILALAVGIIGFVFLMRNTKVGKSVQDQAKTAVKVAALA